MAHDEQEQIIQQLASVSVEQLVATTVSTLMNVAFLRLGAVRGAEQHADPDQARIAIDAIGALEPLITQALPPDAAQELRQTLASLRIAYASATGSEPPAAPRPPQPGGAGGPPPRPGPNQPHQPPPPPRPRIWTPRGDV